MKNLNNLSTKPGQYWTATIPVIELRDYLAGQAMQALINHTYGDLEAYQNTPFRAYEFADAMLKQREER